MTANVIQTPQDLLYRGLFEHSLVEVHMWRVLRDADGTLRTWQLVDANPNALRSWGKTLEEVVGLTTEEIFPGADATGTFMPIVDQVMSTGVPHEWEMAFPITKQVLHMISFPVGEYFVSTGFDVTGQRLQEQELHDALKSLKQATSAAKVGLWDWDLTSNTLRYSDEWKAQIGYAPHEITNSYNEWESRVHPEDLEPTLKQIKRKLEHPDSAYSVSFRLRHKDGSYRWILAQSSVVTEDEGHSVRMVGSHIDITERRQLEEQVIKTQKLKSVGTLAAGIAHDFNNLLAAIIGNLSLLKESDPTAPDRLTLLSEVEDAAIRAKSLTSQLLTFAKGGAPVRKIASVKEVIVESAMFVSRGSTSRCEFAVDDDLSNVNADIDQISQVVENLVINAVQAMKNGGTIHVGARNVVLPETNQWDLSPGHYVQVSVADQGGGIDNDDLPRVFDPFYTTKSTGSGLGLSTSYSIIDRHYGRLTVTSEVGRGSVFTFFLPASKASPMAAASPTLVHGSGRILVMDDDAPIRRLMKRLLERIGYDCDAAPDGDTALGLYSQARNDGRPYRAVILDLTIPGNDGGGVVLSRLRNIDPNVVAIVASGYADDDVLSGHDKHGFNGRLKKPTDLPTLSVELARVLQAGAVPS